MDQLLPDILAGTIQPGKVFDVTTDPDGYRDMDVRTSLKVLIAL